MALIEIPNAALIDAETERCLEVEYAQSAEQDRIICAEFDGTLMDGLESEDWS